MERDLKRYIKPAARVAAGGGLAILALSACSDSPEVALFKAQGTATAAAKNTSGVSKAEATPTSVAAKTEGIRQADSSIPATVNVTGTVEARVSATVEATLKERQAQSSPTAQPGGKDGGPVATATARPANQPAVTTVVMPTPMVGLREYPTPSVSTSIDDIELKARERYDAPAGSFVKGDVMVNGIRIYDNNPDTGAAVYLPEGAQVDALYGANITLRLNDRILDNFRRHNMELMLQNGCIKGCLEIHEYRFEGGKLVPVKVWNKSNLNEGAATSAPAVPTARVSGAPTPAAKTEASSADECPAEPDHHMKAGERFRVNARSIVKGDVTVGGVRLFDDNDRTALVVEINPQGYTGGSVEVLAPYGANVTCVGSNEDVFKRVKDQAVRESENGGRRVDVVAMPGGRRQS